MMVFFRGLLLTVILASWLGGPAAVYAAQPAADNELPDLEEKDEWDEETGSADDANAPLTHYYYDFRTSERFCLTPQEAKARRLSPQNHQRPCKR
jgi:hypothetical protein